VDGRSYEGAYTAMFARLREKYTDAADEGRVQPPPPPRPATDGSEGLEGHAAAATGAAAGGASSRGGPKEQLEQKFSNLIGGFTSQREKLLGNWNEKVKEAVEKGRESVQPGGKHAAKLEGLKELKEGLGSGLGSVVRGVKSGVEGVKSMKIGDGMKLDGLLGGPGGGARLPAGWSWARDGEGHPYFYNRSTGVVTYDDPREDASLSSPSPNVPPLHTPPLAPPPPSMAGSGDASANGALTASEDPAPVPGAVDPTDFGLGVGSTFDDSWPSSTAAAAEAPAVDSAAATAVPEATLIDMSE